MNQQETTTNQQETATRDYQGVEMRWGDKLVRIPALLLTVLLGVLGAGGAAGGYAATKPDQEGEKPTQVERLLEQQVSETILLRRAVESSNRQQNLRKLEHDIFIGDLGRIKARDVARDKLLHLDEKLREFPLDPPFSSLP